MPVINVTNEVMQLIRSMATLEWRQTGVQRPDGSWDVPLSDDTAKYIEHNRQDGETFSDAILRLAAKIKGLN